MVEVTEARRVGAKLQYRLVRALIMQSLAKYSSMGVRPWTHGICLNPVECWECWSLDCWDIQTLAWSHRTGAQHRAVGTSHTHTRTG